MISAASRVCVYVCVCETPHHQPIIRISADDPAEAWGKKSKLLSFGLAPPQWTKPVTDALTLWAIRANSSIYIYVCKTASTLPLKQCKWNLVALLICLFFHFPKNPQIDVDLNLCAAVMHHWTLGNDRKHWADKTDKRVHDVTNHKQEPGETAPGFNTKTVFLKHRCDTEIWGWWDVWWGYTLIYYLPACIGN